MFENLSFKEEPLAGNSGSEQLFFTPATLEDSQTDKRFSSSAAPQKTFKYDNIPNHPKTTTSTATTTAPKAPAELHVGAAPAFNFGTFPSSSGVKDKRNAFRVKRETTTSSNIQQKREEPQPKTLQQPIPGPTFQFGQGASIPFSFHADAVIPPSVAATSVERQPIEFVGNVNARFVFGGDTNLQKGKADEWTPVR
ncbi:UNVERIFIED_CONTAM: hypothetical protein HDU68_006508 [Siphonaria sp. JEL0065]|nr:hypothetical protein HDU68_006508 [Siphonaria sp. JEL0065]